MPPSQIHLVSAADARFFPGLVTALGTAIGRASGRFDYRVTVLDGGLSDEQWETLSISLRRIAGESAVALDLNRVTPDAQVIEAYPTRRGSHLTYARLMIPRLFDDEYIVYIDSDVVCLRGIEEFWEGLTGGVSLTAARDPLKNLGRDRTVRNALPRDAWSDAYFNAGIIGINTGQWRDPSVERRMSHLLEHAQAFKYVDQSLLNIVFHKHWHEVPTFGNFVLTLERCSRLPEMKEPANLHFVGSRKPWLSNDSLFYRWVPDRLFDYAYKWVLGGRDMPARRTDAVTLEKARRKALLYTLLLYRRARIYRSAVSAVATQADAAQSLWDRFGFG